MPQLHQTQDIINYRPLENREFKHQIQKQIHKKLVDTLSECFSAYLQSVHIKKQSFQFKQRGCNTDRHMKEKLSLSNQSILSNINGDQQIQIKRKIVKITNRFQDDMFGLVCSMLKLNKSKQSKTEESTNLNQTSRSQLTESNKNFIIELLYKLSLFQSYKGIDRSFSKLINEAQKRYYSIQRNIHNQSTGNSSKEIKNLRNRSISHQEYLISSNQTISMRSSNKNDTISMQRRLQQTNKNFDLFATLEETAEVKGYSQLKQLCQKSQKKFKNDNKNKSNSNSFLKFENANDRSFIKKPNEKQSEQHAIIIKNWKKSLIIKQN